MAHLVPLDRNCVRCPRRARFLLRNEKNAPMGQFCESCGRAAEAELQAEEEAAHARRGDPPITAYDEP